MKLRPYPSHFPPVTTLDPGQQLDAILVQDLPVENDKGTLQLSRRIVRQSSKLRLNHEGWLPAPLASVGLKAWFHHVLCIPPIEVPICRLREKKQAQVLSSLADLGNVLASGIVRFRVHIWHENRVQISHDCAGHSLDMLLLLRRLFMSEEIGCPRPPPGQVEAAP